MSNGVLKVELEMAIHSLLAKVHQHLAGERELNNWEWILIEDIVDWWQLIGRKEDDNEETIS